MGKGRAVERSTSTLKSSGCHPSQMKVCRAPVGQWIDRSLPISANRSRTDQGKVAGSNPAGSFLFAPFAARSFVGEAGGVVGEEEGSVGWSSVGGARRRLFFQSSLLLFASRLRLSLPALSQGGRESGKRTLVHGRSIAVGRDSSKRQQSGRFFSFSDGRWEKKTLSTSTPLQLSHLSHLSFSPHQNKNHYHIS